MIVAMHGGEWWKVTANQGGDGGAFVCLVAKGGDGGACVLAWQSSLRTALGLILERIGLVAYKLELPKELSNVHSTFHISNLKKYLSDESLIIPMKELRLDDKLNFVEEQVDTLLQESLYPFQDKLTSGDKSLDLSAFKLSRLFFTLLSSWSSSCWRSYEAQ
ncbi:hypothetical protein Tco_0753875 [Tanacetum coccineum]